MKIDVAKFRELLAKEDKTEVHAYIKEFTDEYVEFFLKYLINEYKKCIDYNNDMIWSITACYKYIESSLFHMFKYNIIKI